MAEVQVIGGGFSGLAAAYFLARAGHKVRLVETGARVGGLLDTLQTPYGPVETAANALLSSQLVEGVGAELGLELTPALRTSRRRFIFRDGRLRRWPLNLISTLRLIGLAVRLIAAGLEKGRSLTPH